MAVHGVLPNVVDLCVLDRNHRIFGVGHPQLTIGTRNIVRGVDQLLPVVAKDLRKKRGYQHRERGVLSRDRLVYSEHLVGTASLRVVADPVLDRAILTNALFDAEPEKGAPLSRLTNRRPPRLCTGRKPLAACPKQGPGSPRDASGS